MNTGCFLQKNSTCTFTVWAPNHSSVTVEEASPETRKLPLQSSGDGYFTGTFEGLKDGFRYFLKTDRLPPLPDPASHFQPEGVFGPSALVDHSIFAWKDNDWEAPELKDTIIYELHIGTFTPEGSFEAASKKLAELKDLGVTAIEIMPVAEFSGRRGWGYDGVFPFAAYSAYGGPTGLKTFVNAAHQAGLAIILDVVYNHLGPEGNVHHQFGPYVTNRYQTPWGPAINFDGPEGPAVKSYFIQNALYWLDTFHVDSLRLDAIQGISDSSTPPFLAELSSAVDSYNSRTGRRCYLIAESDLNDSGVINKREEGGLGIHSTWIDDFHHTWHVLLTGEQAGYYQDFSGFPDLRTVYQDVHFYQGNYSNYRGRPHGNSVSGHPLASICGLPAKP